MTDMIYLAFDKKNTISYNISIYTDTVGINCKSLAVRALLLGPKSYVNNIGNYRICRFCF